MAEGHQTITQEFLETKHNPVILRKISNLEVPPEMVENDRDLENIIATTENLEKSLSLDAAKPQDSNTEKAKGKETEPVASGGGCCVIL